MSDFLDNTDEAFVEALFRFTRRPVEVTHTGGGCMVTIIYRGILNAEGQQLWVTRDGDDWLIGLYDFDADPEDEGEVASLWMATADKDDPKAVAQHIHRWIVRMSGWAV